MTSFRQHLNHFATSPYVMTFAAFVLMASANGVANSVTQLLPLVTGDRSVSN